VKLKTLPEDFVVEELTNLFDESELLAPDDDSQPPPRGTEPIGRGRHALYKLTKRKIGTLEALATIQRSFNVTPKRISRGGLKDKHAVTSQFITIAGGPGRSLEREDLKLEYIGSTERPLEPGDIVGNRFSIAVRSLSEEQLDQCEERLGPLKELGLPNYFDDQRFGSVTADGEFIAQAWINKDYERALWLTFAEFRREDRAAEKKQKELLRDNWGDWPQCKALLERSHRRSIITFLDDRPGDFKGAWARVDRELRSLYLSAYQSHLWNRLLAAYLRHYAPPLELVDVPLKTGAVPFVSRAQQTAVGDEGSPLVELFDELRATTLPLPSVRLKLDSINNPAERELLRQLLIDADIDLPSVKVHHPRDCYFSRARRPAFVTPEGLTWSRHPDDLNNGKQLLRLQFDLPPGAYATMLIKAITHEEIVTSDDEEE